MKRVHGHAGTKQKTTEYNIWRSMVARCHCPTNKAYYAYGARGISVDPEWRDFRKFYADMGPRPGLGYSLDRIDNDAGYNSGNCRWATQKEQARNSRKCSKVVRSDGVVHVSISEAAEVAKVTRWKIVACLRSPSKAVNGYSYSHYSTQGEAP